MIIVSGTRLRKCLKIGDIMVLLKGENHRMSRRNYAIRNAYLVLVRTNSFRNSLFYV